MSDKTLRAGLIRLAHSHPEFRKDLMPLITACGPEAPMQGKFEEGKPADPTKNMSPEDAAEWKKQTELNKDKFKGAAKSKMAGMAIVRRTTSIAVRVITAKSDGGQGKLITGQMSLDFGGNVQPDAVRFAAQVVPDEMGTWTVKSFTTQKTVSGGGAEILLGVLKAALQEAVTMKGESLFGAAL